ncbi:uncharacterized protein [Haliotis cracherodii]|uniref:uncharacterized protein n=1 Tax=Haliotis cracherodii TaxID=6455 RepID=UPI0039EAE301
MCLNTIYSIGCLLLLYMCSGQSVRPFSFTTDPVIDGCFETPEGSDIAISVHRDVSENHPGLSYSIYPRGDNTAMEVEDYDLHELRENFEALRSITFGVHIRFDGTPEPEERFEFTLSAPDYSPLVIAFCIPGQLEPPTMPPEPPIIPPEPPIMPPEPPKMPPEPPTTTTTTTTTTTQPPLVFSANAKTCVTESLGQLVIRIGRPSSDRSTMTAAVTYTNSDAVSTTDFANSVTTLAFQNGKRNAYLEVPIIDDLVVESQEEFSITISASGYDDVTIKGCINDDDAAVLFDCNRYGVACKAGVCPPSSPTCDCSSATGRTGDDCGIIQSDINGTGCSVMDCGSNGQCVSNGSTGACVCNSGYYNGNAEKCERKRTTITSCDNNKMTICMNPINLYRPLITVSGYTSTECTANPVGGITDTEDRIPSDIQGQCITVGFSGSCGTYTTKTQGGNVCYTIPYRIQYNPNMLLASDEVVYGNCCVNESGQTISTDAILADTATNFLNKQQEIAHFLGVKLSTTLSNGRPISNPVPLNQIYKLCLNIVDDDFSYLGLIRIIVHNGQTDSSRKEAVVFGNDGCSDESGKAIVHSYPSRVSDTQICMQYRPGYFRPGPAALVHDMKYKLCLSGDQAGCQLTTCGVTGDRKKRQTNDGRVESTANTTVYFEDDTTTASQTNGDTSVSPTAKNCLPDMSVMFPAIIVVCIVALILLLIIVYMCFLLMKKRRKQEDEDNEVKSQKSRMSHRY